MEAQAVAKYIRIGPRKVRRFLPLIRRQHVDRALAVLATQGSPSTEALTKCLKSAIANAENNHGMSPDELYIAEAVVNESFRIPRIKPRARGRADRMHRPACHIKIVVTDGAD
jgi:large subunit ribosomal protein L22